MTHRVVTYKMKVWPFKKMWSCECGFLFKASYLGPALVREFRAHKESVE